MKPTIGRIVIYKLTDADKAKLKELGRHNPNNGAEEAPAMVVRVWSDICVNLRVILDGDDTLWVTSASLGDQPRQWQWPPRV
jgi:hypothetical protein